MQETDTKPHTGTSKPSFVSGFFDSVRQKQEHRMEDAVAEPAAPATMKDTYIPSARAVATAVSDRASSDRAVIPKDMVIDGSISSTSDILVRGRINGDVTAGHIDLHGVVNGNVIAESITLGPCEIQGNLTCSKMIVQEAQSTVVGDIRAAGADIGGTVTGRLTINGNLTLRTTAVVDGDIETKTMSVAERAVLNGVVKIIR